MATKDWYHIMGDLKSGQGVCLHYSVCSKDVRFLLFFVIVLEDKQILVKNDVSLLRFGF